MKTANEHIHSGEQYPLEIKEVMDNAEQKMTREVSSAFSKWNAPIYKWAIGIIQDFISENQQVRKADEEPIIPTQKELTKELDTALSIDDFLIDNSVLAVSMQKSVGYTFEMLATEVGSKSMASSILAAMHLSFDIQYDMNLYNRILAERKEWLARKLYDTTIDRIPEIISNGIANGATIDEMTKAIQDVLAMDKDRAAKIARTETNYAANEAIREQTHTLGIMKYRISTAIDACEICMMAATKEYTYKEAKELLPLHPNDRCVLQSVIPDSWLGIKKSIKERGIQKTVGMGYIPIKGQDYYTEDEIDEVKKAVTPVRGKDYLTKEELVKVKEEIAPKKGIDYLVKKEIEEIRKEITPVKGVDYNDGKTGKQGRTPKKGVDYFTKGEIEEIKKEITPVKGEDYVDGSPDTPDEIVEKLESIQEENNKLSTNAIKNFDKEVRKRIPKVEIKGGGGSGKDWKVKVDGTDTENFLEEKIEAGSNVTISKTNGKLRIASTGAGGTADHAELDNLDYANSGHTGFEPSLPATPVNPGTKFLDGNKQWTSIAIGAGGFAGNLYFTTLDSADVTGYKQISYNNEAAQTELSGTLTNQEVLFRTYIYDFPIDTTIIDAGVWVANYRVRVSGTQGVTQLKMEVFLYHLDTTETILWSDYSPEINNTTYETIRSESNQPAFTCLETDRLGVRVYAKVTANNAITINTIVGDGDASYFTTPLGIRHNQLRDLNGDDDFQHIDATDRTNLDNLSGTNTGDQDLSGYALKTNVLELDNTTAFTPDADYEPATKKYVDDNITGDATSIQGFDVTTTDPTDGKILVYRTASSSYVLEDKPAAGSNPAASDVSFVPAGDISSTDVQNAIQELDTEKSSKAFVIAMAVAL